MPDQGGRHRGERSGREPEPDSRPHAPLQLPGEEHSRADRRAAHPFVGGRPEGVLRAAARKVQEQVIHLKRIQR